MRQAAAEQNRREVRIGLRISLPPLPDGPRHIGTEEVNDLIARGWRVMAIIPQSVAFQKTGEPAEEGMVSLALTGWDMTVRLEPPTQPRKRRWWCFWR